MSLEWVVFVLLVVAGSGRAQSEVSGCPTPNGFFADAQQCDKYYHCLDDVLTEKVCPDGMAFNDLNPKVEKCDFLFQVNCDERPDLQKARPSENCPRQNGYFPHPEPTNCHQFYYCTGGQSSQLTCPEGLSFSVNSGTCVWPDQAGRSNCVSEKLLNFTCPSLPPSSTEVHPRFADPEDCQYFYVCINGKEPRRNGCAFGQVFNNLTKTCDAPKDVPECKDYYTEYFDNYFSTLNPEQGGRVSTDVIAAAIASGYPVPKHRNRVRVQLGQATQAPQAAEGDAPSRRPRATPRRPPPTPSPRSRPRSPGTPSRFSPGTEWAREAAGGLGHTQSRKGTLLEICLCFFFSSFLSSISLCFLYLDLSLLPFSVLQAILPSVSFSCPSSLPSSLPLFLPPSLPPSLPSSLPSSHFLLLTPSSFPISFLRRNREEKIKRKFECMMSVESASECVHTT
ncbi:hypothetical protein C7M84_012117 [Penaeus vannamei]|uniref:Chitin-binding type-2 domain-containing protein n=1 Tax=Penaeus vannamei TaxID=6689 RepID=A0A423SZI5_PENVA|nr:hypothetical protein C7M84_012117 [Penaeus vannamei]